MVLQCVASIQKENRKFCLSAEGLGNRLCYLELTSEAKVSKEKLIWHMYCLGKCRTVTRHSQKEGWYCKLNIWQDFTLEVCIGTWIPWDLTKKSCGSGYFFYCHAGRNEQLVMNLMRQCGDCVCVSTCAW